MAEREPPPRGAYEPGRRYYTPTVGASACAVFALALLVFGSFRLYRTVELAKRGTVVNGEVVAVQYDSRSDFVKVRLPKPVDQTVELITWSGRPNPGESIHVRFDPAAPTVAEEAGTWPWWDLTTAFGGGVFFALGCWWRASRDWRREGRASASLRR